MAGSADGDDRFPVWCESGCQPRSATVSPAYARPRSERSTPPSVGRLSHTTGVALPPSGSLGRACDSLSAVQQTRPLMIVGATRRRTAQNRAHTAGRPTTPTSAAVITSRLPPPGKPHRLAVYSGLTLGRRRPVHNPRVLQACAALRISLRGYAHVLARRRRPTTAPRRRAKVKASASSPPLSPTPKGSATPSSSSAIRDRLPASVPGVATTNPGHLSPPGGNHPIR